MTIIEKMDISFIIPVFNGQKTITRCLDSIYNVGFSKDSFEVLVIDDCSTDMTTTIVDDYASNHNNLVLIRQTKNHRQGAARNRGISQARGLYIMLVDADDTVEAGLSKALDYAKNTLVDMLWCQWRKQKVNGEFELVTSSFEYSRIVSGFDFCEHYYDMMVYGSPCTYLIKKSYIHSLGIKFVEDRRMEDVDWTEKYLFYSNSFSCSQSIVYSYYYNEESTMHSFNAERDADALMYSIRRMQFADVIINSCAKQFSSKIIEYSSNWICRILSFRHLTRHNAKSIYTLFKCLDSGSLSYLSNHKCFHRWPSFTRLCIKYPILICSIIVLVHPCAKIARYIYRSFFI